MRRSPVVTAVLIAVAAVVVVALATLLRAPLTAIGDAIDGFFVGIHQGALDLKAQFIAKDWPLGAYNTIILVGKLAVIFVIVILVGAYSTWVERKIMAYMQDRLGPTRVGRFGLLQPLADGIKLLQKECIIPLGADRNFHYWAPILVFIPALLGTVIIPFGRLPAGVEGEPLLMVSDLNVGVLYFFALGAFGVLGIFLAAWGSNSKYSAYGGFRAVAQLVSYEIPIAFCIMSVVTLAGSLSVGDIVAAQTTLTERTGVAMEGPAASVLGLSFPVWFVIPQFLAFVIFFIAGVAETNRTPFDLPEAESELVSGFHTEYSGLRFAFFFLAEYVNIFIFASMTAVLFLGGPAGPTIWFLGTTLSSVLWFSLKVFLAFFTVVWLRATLPRLRIDQLMNFCWKRLLPLSMINFFFTAAFVLLARMNISPHAAGRLGGLAQDYGRSGWLGYLALVGVVTAGVVWWLLREARERYRKAEAA